MSCTAVPLVRRCAVPRSPSRMLIVAIGCSFLETAMSQGWVSPGSGFLPAFGQVRNRARRTPTGHARSRTPHERGHERRRVALRPTPHGGRRPGARRLSRRRSAVGPARADRPDRARLPSWPRSADPAARRRGGRVRPVTAGSLTADVMVNPGAEEPAAAAPARAELDPASRAWVASLRVGAPDRDAAITRLHDLLLR